MTDNSGQDSLPAELNNLTGIERSWVAKRYQAMLAKQARLAPSASIKTNVISESYILVARFWLAMGGPLTFAAACAWSVGGAGTARTVAICLTVAAALPMSMMCLRISQAMRAKN